MAWVLIFIFFLYILALHYKTPYPRHVSIKKMSAALYIILSIKVFVYSRLIMPSAIKSYLSFVVFTAGQHSPKCVGAINLKTQESAKEEDQRIHSFVLEILWGCYKIKTCTLFSLWHFLVHLEILCIFVHHRIYRHFCSVWHHLRRNFCFLWYNIQYRIDLFVWIKNVQFPNLC